MASPAAIPSGAIPSGSVPAGAIPPGALAIPSLGTTFGALFMGMVTSSILFGITNLQTYIYFQWYPKDPISFKASVATLWTLDAVTLAFNIHAVYFYFVSNYGNPLALLDVAWSLKYQLILTAIMIPLIQSLYTVRVFKLRGEDRVIPGLLVLCVLGSWAVSLVTAVRIGGYSIFLQGFHDEKQTLDAYFSFSTGVDIIVSLCLCYYLYRSSESTFARQDGLIRTLMFWVLSTGLLTSTCSVVMLTTFVAMPRNLVCLATEIVSAKLYINSYLAMLNARRVLRERAAGRMVNLSDLDKRNGTWRGPMPLSADHSTQSKTAHSEDVMILSPIRGVSDDKDYSQQV